MIIFCSFEEKFTFMKKCSIIFGFTLLVFACSIINAKEQSLITLTSSSSSLIIKFQSPSFDLLEVETSRGISSIPLMSGASPMMIEGAPNLPKYACSYILPDALHPKIQLLNSSYTDFILDVAPSKGNLTRSVIPSNLQYNFGEQYGKNEFFPSLMYEAQTPYIVRDFNAQALWIFPMQYNPVSKVLRVYDSLELEIKFQSSIKYPSSMDSQFEMIYEDLFINYDASKSSSLSHDDGGMLIISDYQFIDQMADFMSWKTQKGISNEIIDIASIGNNQEALKTFIADYYHNHNLTYVLFVGDHQHIPAYQIVDSSYTIETYYILDTTFIDSINMHIDTIEIVLDTVNIINEYYSDNYYGYIEGDDSYPEVFIGRFSAEDSIQVTTQVNRVIQYEQNPILSEAYAKSVGVASNEGPGDDGEYDYQHLRNIREELLNYTYTSVYELYDGTQDGEDAEGNPTASDLHNLLQEGIGLINYTGHGSSFSCASSGYSINDVNQLTNTEVHPFFWSVACVNGNFMGATCFAEAWLRATDSETGKPSGAIATLMSTINQYWFPPMEGQDHMNLILTEMSSNSQSRSFGGISMNGCMQMNDTYGISGAEMTDTWTCFGDPSVMVRTKVPDNMVVSFNSEISSESNSLEVFCSKEDALVCLTQDGEIIGKGFVSEGLANLSLENFSSLNSILVTVTASNTVPHIGSISLLDSEIISQQVINFPLGWSFFSTYILPDDKDIASVLSALDDEIIVVKDFEGWAYFPNWNYNGIGDIKVGHGYNIKLLNAFDLTIPGSYLFPDQNPISLIEGWNLIGYLRLYPASVEAVFESINNNDNLFVVRDQNGDLYWPEYGFDGIHELKPGRAYQVKTNSADILQYLPNSESY